MDWKHYWHARLDALAPLFVGANAVCVVVGIILLSIWLVLREEAAFRMPGVGLLLLGVLFALLAFFTPWPSDLRTPTW